MSQLPNFWPKMINFRAKKYAIDYFWNSITQLQNLISELEALVVGVAKKNWMIMEITANFWKDKFFNPNDETHFDFLIGWIPRAHTECPRSLCSVVEQASWALRVRPGDSSDQKIEMGFIIRVQKLSFSEICSYFHDRSIFFGHP